MSTLLLRHAPLPPLSTPPKSPFPTSAPKLTASSSSSSSPSSNGTNAPLYRNPLGISLSHFSQGPWSLSLRPPRRTLNGFPISRPNATSGESDGHERLVLGWIENARKVFDGLPQPVKSFPWMRFLGIFQNLAFGLALVVAKYLAIPLLAISSLSEMSYCAHERKMGFIPIPFLAGFVVAGVANHAAIDLSSDLKEADDPWHLVLIAAFFLLIKLPGPYYPYLGRLCIPHFANGGLWRTAWLAFMWYKRWHEKATTE
ncbi:uncharacterized protein LOC109714908 isoform X3 [Ananas comosus]|uniref:Uncharacterized protein LOC109714908 isoform X3 n=1 Tax=Ananas comosus TaxID=4615 RepID=A0A6P5FH06_ANACO|nr:uncharacterized protein LOC109714908 isoform X3 [Ananas comosus]